MDGIQDGTETLRTRQWLTCSTWEYRLACNTQILTCEQHTNSYLHATHEIWLVYALLTSVRHMTYRSHAAHKIYLMCTTRILLTSSSFRVTCECWLSHSTKLKATRVLGTCKCQLRRDLYCMYVHTYVGILSSTCIDRLMYLSYYYDYVLSFIYML